MTAGFGTRELHEVVQLVRAVARTEIMPHFRALRPGDVRAKSGPTDLVTIADEKAEQRLTEALHRLFPGCVVVGEEAATHDPALLGTIGTSDLCFIVDPIDGTSNFCAGLPLFGVMVAVVQHGAVVGAVIHDPIGDDTATALTGQGAWMEMATGERTRLQVAAPVSLSSMTGAVSWRYMAEPRRSIVCRNLLRLGAAWDYRCAAHQYRILAAGHCHYAVYQRLLPWDHAAGWLLHKEAGGWSARFDGSSYDPAQITGGLICAPDEAGWRAILDDVLEEATPPV